MIEWRIDDAVTARIPGAHIGFLEIGGVRSPAGGAVWEAIEEEANGAKLRFTMESLYHDARIAGMRTMYRALGIDPARYRPSSERLLRRILQGKGLYRVNPVVDACNLISVRTRIPLGLYDGEKVRGSIELRFGRPGESYLALTGNETGIEGKFIVADEDGPIGSPTTDSERTKIEPESSSVLLLTYAPSDCGDAAAEAMDGFSGLLCGDMGGTERSREIRKAGG